MLGNIVISGVFFAFFSAGMLGTITSAIGMKENFKDKDWAGGFGLLACCVLFLALLVLVICGWICCLAILRGMNNV